jgi:hypothetical protein
MKDVGPWTRLGELVVCSEVVPQRSRSSRAMEIECGPRNPYLTGIRLQRPKKEHVGVSPQWEAVQLLAIRRTWSAITVCGDAATIRHGGKYSQPQPQNHPPAIARLLIWWRRRQTLVRDEGRWSSRWQ